MYPGATDKRTALPCCDLKRHKRSIMSIDKAVLGSPLTQINLFTVGEYEYCISIIKLLYYVRDVT